MRRHLSRREAIRLAAGSVAGALLVPGCEPPPDFLLLPAVGADVDTTALPPTHLCGTFEVRDDSAIAWIGAPGPAVAELELWPDDGTPGLEGAVSLREEDGFVAAHRFAGLLPGHEYRYRAHFAPGGPGPWLRFRTAPRASDAAPVCFLFCADIGPNEKLHDIFPGLAVRAEDLYLHLGDWPYADKSPAARTVDEFRDKHRQVRAPRAIQEFMWRVPIAPIFDDHDITNGWNRSLLDSDPDLHRTGMQVWNEFFPLASPTAYRDFRWGMLAHFFVLDTRTYRDDPDLTAAGERRFLGSEQYDWLTAGLSGSDAVFKFIVTSVPFDFNGSIDDWGAYELEKSRLRGFLAGSGAENVIFLTADRHWFAARHLADGLREFQVGPLAAGLGMYPDAFPPEVVASALVRNYGAISIAPDLERGVATLRFTCRDEHHLPVYEEIIEAPLA